MHRKFAIALAGIALYGATATSAAAGGGYLVVQETRAYYVTPHGWPYQNSVRGPFIIGRYAPRIAIAPARFYAYPYVSTFDTCVRWRRVPARHGWRSQRVWVCG